MQLINLVYQFQNRYQKPDWLPITLEIIIGNSGVSLYVHVSNLLLLLERDKCNTFPSSGPRRITLFICFSLYSPLSLLLFWVGILWTFLYVITKYPYKPVQIHAPLQVTQLDSQVGVIGESYFTSLKKLSPGKSPLKQKGESEYP